MVSPLPLIMLTPVEVFWLTWHTHQPNKKAARQAQAILFAHRGLPAPEIALSLKLSDSAVARLLAGFAAQRLGLFPTPALFVEEVLHAARVEMAHARQVADLALQLFDASAALHHLPAPWRTLTETAALLHNVGVEIDEPEHHLAGRDLLMAMRLVGHSDLEQRVLACSIRFHRKRARPHKEPLFAALSPAAQTRTLALSALVRIADGLDYSQTQSTQLNGVHVHDHTIHLTVAGPHAETDGARAVAKADLWTTVFGQTWTAAPPPPDVAALARLPLTAESPMAQAAVRAVADQWQRWQAAEPAARAGEVLGIKNVRAAARRARAALDLWRPYFKNKALKPLRQGLKQAEAALGPARDWDVVIAAAEAVAGAEVWPLLDTWRAARAQAWQAAIAWLDQPATQALRADLAAFLAKPPTRRTQTATIVETAEAALHATLTPLRTYAAALDAGDLNTFHQLRRLGIKRCRFALEFLAPVFQDRAQRPLRAIIKVQDRLGALNDACVLKERLAPLLRLTPEPEGAAALAAYCEAEIREQLRRFWRDWEDVQPAPLATQFTALAAGLRPARLEIPTDLTPPGLRFTP